MAESLEKVRGEPGPSLIVEHEGVRMAFATPNRVTAWRVETLFTKEPDTIEWIASFDPADVLLDVGANVGMYTVWAAKTRGVRVYAFEPESQNYAILNRNIYLNGLSEQVSAYCVALSDHTGFGQLYLSELVTGSSCHTFGEPLDHNLRQRAVAFSQGCFSSTIDALIEQNVMPVPQHIKIDVDGIEHSVIRGASKTLADTRVRSLLVEINSNLDDHWEIVDHMLDLGFDYSREQVEQAMRTEGAFKGVGNYVFKR